MANEYQIRLYTILQVLNKLRGKLSKKMFEYLRDAFHFIPSPIKISNGHGLIALYPEWSINHIQRILTEKDKGKTFGQVKEEIKDDTDKLFATTDFLRQRINSDKSFKHQVVSNLKTSDHPAFIYKLNPVVSEVELVTAKGRIEDIKYELMQSFKSWDGKSTAKLNTIKQKIEELEAIESRRNISRQISEVFVQ